MIVLDTTVLVFAVGEAHPLRSPCQRLVDAIGDRLVRAATTAEVVQEFAHVRARRRDRDDAVRHARRYSELLAPHVTVTEHALRRGLDLYRDHERLGAFDAVLAAAALNAGATALISADRAFADVPGLRHVYPDDAGIDALLQEGA